MARTRLRRVPTAICLALVARAVQAQSAPPDSSWHGWFAVALGPGGANGDGRVAGDITLTFTRDRLALWVRDAGVTRFLEPGDLYDVSVLAGVHPRTERHLDVIAGAGLGVSRGHDSSGANLASQPAVGAGAQVTLNYRVIGVGLDAFATISGSRHYYGLGVAVALGVFR